MFQITKRFGNENSGGTSFEYGLIAAGIAVGITMAVTSLGTYLKSTFAQAAGSQPSASSAVFLRPARLQDGPFP
jgi:Flp pilus assembly pilin Flp